MKRYEDTLFTGADLQAESFAGAEFERCTFRNGRWMEADLRKSVFIECAFEQCDLSNAQVDRTGFRQVIFRGCKLLGIPFDRSHPFLLAFGFEQCRLDFAILRSLALKDTTFKHCSLVEVDLSGADLRQAVFDDCDLAGAVFDETELTGADLRTARNFLIDPTRNRIKGAHFDLHGLPGLLAQYGIKVAL